MSDSFWIALPLTLTAIGTIITTVVSIWTHRGMSTVVQQTNHLAELAIKQAGDSGQIQGRQDAIDERTARDETI